MPPPGTLASVEQFRRLHDPAFHRIAAHVGILPPFEPSDANVLDLFDAAALPPRFTAEFGAPAAVGRALVLPLTGGAREGLALQAALARLLLGPADAGPALAPALRIGLFSSDAEMEMARRALTSLESPPGFGVTEVSLLLEDLRGLWHPVRSLRLAN